MSKERRAKETGRMASEFLSTPKEIVERKIYYTTQIKRTLQIKDISKKHKLQCMYKHVDRKTKSVCHEA